MISVGNLVKKDNSKIYFNKSFSRKLFTHYPAGAMNPLALHITYE